VSYVGLTPLLAAEVPVAEPTDLQRLWLRGGFPLSHLARDEEASYAWRQDFIRTFLQRDLPGMGVRVPAETSRRFWRMLAHLQGQLFNASQLAMSLGGASHSTAGRYLDVLVDTMMVRRLPPHLANVGKRLVKSPKVYLRDSGVLHALLGLATVRDLQGHPIAGASWEGFVVEQVAAALPPEAQLGFYRTAAGTELDLVIELGARRVRGSQIVPLAGVGRQIVESQARVLLFLNEFEPPMPQPCLEQVMIGEEDGHARVGLQTGAPLVAARYR